LPLRRSRSAAAYHCCVRCFSGHGPPKVEREAERQSRAKLAYRPPVDQSIARGDVERELVIHLPNGADQGGVRLLPVEDVVEIELRDRPHLPFIWSLDDRVEKHLTVLVWCECSGNVEVDSA